MNDPMLPLPGLSPVSGKRVEVKFDGGLLSSDGGVLALREVDQRLRVADRLAACMVDRRAPDQITHSLADIIRFRLLMIAAGYEDGNDANCLRSDPMFKMALDLTPTRQRHCPRIRHFVAGVEVGRPLYLPDELMGFAERTGLLFLADIEARLSVWRARQGLRRALRPTVDYTAR